MWQILKMDKIQDSMSKKYHHYLPLPEMAICMAGPQRRTMQGKGTLRTSAGSPR